LEPWMFFLEGRKLVVQVETGEFSTFLLIYSNLLLQRMVVHKPTGMDRFHEEREPAPLKDTSDTCRLGTYKRSFGIHQSIYTLYNLSESAPKGRRFHPRTCWPGSSRSAPFTPAG
ncbi:MAG: hypothetical protein WAO36_09905, partial [Candidatus Methanoculleus thermohydrogenotrophicum]